MLQRKPHKKQKHKQHRSLPKHLLSTVGHSLTPQWGAAHAEIQVPSGENTELEGSPFEAWGRSVCGHTCYANCHGFLPR